MEEWVVINQFILLALLLLVAKVIKEKIPLFRKFIIPTALLAGFIGLIISTQVLGSFIPTNNNFKVVRDFLTVDNEFFVNVIYHALGIGFIAMALKHSDKKMSNNSRRAGMIIVMTYLVQGIVGFTITILIFKFFNPNLFAGAGLLLPLGFGQGPGMASSIGNSESWQQFFVPGGGVSFGQTIAAIGFIWGGIIGIIMLNYYIKKKGIEIDNKIDKKIYKERYEFETIGQVRFLDSLTVQVVMILVVYFLAYVVIELSNVILPLIDGDKSKGIGHDIAGLMKSFNYLFGILFALLLKRLLNWFQKRGHRTKFATNNYILSNITSLMFNVMITASIISISLVVVQEYWIEILIITTIGGIVTLFFLSFIIKKVFDKNLVEYLISMFGMLTGTISTGIGLLKSLDKDYESDVPENLVVGSAYALLFAFPLLAVLSLPVTAKTENNEIYNYIGLGILIVYLIILLGITFFFLKTKIKK